MNTDLILREHLAIERNPATPTKQHYSPIFVPGFISGGGLNARADCGNYILVDCRNAIDRCRDTDYGGGCYSFLLIKKSIVMSRKNIGHSSAEFIRTVRGNKRPYPD